MRGTRVAGMFVVAATLVVAGCGDDSDPTTTTPPSVEKPPAGDVRLEKLGDFDQPLFVAQPRGSDDLYVVEKPGRVQRLGADGKTTLALDIDDEVPEESEQGLLSIAFDPDFEASHLAYAYFTGNDENQHVAEFEVAGDGAFDPASRREVLTMDDFASNHNGGLLMFGPEGDLYIGTGDGGIADDPERNAQDLGSPLGKILRIDPHQSGKAPYAIPADNPFAGTEGARGEVYAYGLRNPWRFSFDRENGDLLIGDVGQNTQEEIDYLPAGAAAGANLGWSAFEGTDRFNEDQEAPGAVEPALTYGRDRGCSVTGGYVVRDPELPALVGRYVYGDFCEGELRSFVPGKKATGDRAVGELEVPNLSSFAEDTAGHLYATSIDGQVFRLRQ